MPLFQSQQVLLAADLNLSQRAGIPWARASRNSSSTANSGAQDVLRLDGVPVYAGRRYTIRTNTLVITSSVVNDRGTARLSMTTNGVSATSANAIWALSNSPAIDSTSDGCQGQCEYGYTPPVDQQLSILLWTNRGAGTGNVRLLVTGSTTIDLEVWDQGDDPGDTGIIL